MPNRTKLYLAGPMRGYDLYNFPAFDEAAARLRVAGYTVISPAELDRAVGFDERTTEPLPDDFMPAATRRDVEALLKVDGIALLPGWERSTGARLELAIARGIGIAAYTVARIHLDGSVAEDGWTALLPLTPEAEAEAIEAAVAAHNAVLEVDPDGVDIEQRLEAWGRGDQALVSRSKSTAWIFDGQSLAVAGEVRVVDATGGAKGSKPQQVGQIPPRFLLALGQVYALGAAKYPDEAPGRPNWSLGYAWSLSYNALHRHLAACWGGEWIDPEDGLPHVVKVAWHAATLYTFHEQGLGVDDRPAYYKAVG